MTAMYRPAPELAERAAPIMKQHHPHLVEYGFEPLWVWRAKASSSKGKLVLGKARKLSGLNAVLLAACEDGAGDVMAGELDEDALVDRFVIEIAADTWVDLDAAQRDSLLDHELCHCGVDFEADPPAPLLVGHDVEEFEAIVARRGLWRPDLERFGQRVQEAAQLSLDDDFKVTISTSDGERVETTGQGLKRAADQLAGAR